jgi:OOP family OmpA-OmpF porin
MISNQTTHITVTGHTDSTGPEAYNQKLSERRANAVADYMANSLGVDRMRMKVSGMGESSPVADNATREGRAKNRRTEIDVIQK